MAWKVYSPYLRERDVTGVELKSFSIRDGGGET